MGFVMKIIRTYMFLIAFTYPEVFCIVVPPAANVSLDCHNFKNVLFWKYRRPDLQPRFIVQTKGYYDDDSEEVCSNISHYQCDVTSSTKKSVVYNVKVTAVVGESQSEPVDLLFTYDQDYKDLVDQACSVDLSGVNITVQSDQSRIRVELPHPFHLYRHAMSEWKQHKVFDFTVVTENSTERVSCDYKHQHVCKADLQVEGGGEKRHCVTIEGQMGNVKAKTLRSICTEPQPPPYSLNYIIYIAMASLVSIVFGCIGWMVYKKITSSSPPLPVFMVSKLSDMVRGSYLRPEETNVSEVHSVNPKGSTPLLRTPTTPSTTPEEIGRYPIEQVSYEERVVGQVMTLSDGTGSSSEDTSEEGGGRDCNSELFGYDRGHVILVKGEMSAGDIVEGYKPAEL